MKKIVAGIGLLFSALISLSIMFSTIFSDAIKGHNGYAWTWADELKGYYLYTAYWILLILSLIGVGLIIWGLVSKEK